MNENKCAFTICTLSYLGLAMTLRKSFLSQNSSFEFFIYIVDFPFGKKTIDEMEIKNAKKDIGLSEKKYLEMAFKYNVTEFCTSLKPFAFLTQFENGYDFAVYLDPDLFFFSKLDEFNEKKDLFIVPHILFHDINERGIWKEQVFLKYGIYNCGFVGFKKTEESEKYLYWWSQKLINEAYSDPENGLFTDQKWMDMLVSFFSFDKIDVIKNIGYDVAPWNLHERELYKTDEEYYCKKIDDESKNGRLVFIHFSGLDYRALSIGALLSKHGKGCSSIFAQLAKNYGEELTKNNSNKYFDIGYLFNQYQNGEIISDVNRLIYRQILKGIIKIPYTVYNPFETSENTLYSFFKKNNLISRRVVKKGRSDNKYYSINKDSRLLIITRKMVRIFVSIGGIDNYLTVVKKINYISNPQKQISLLLKEDKGF